MKRVFLFQESVPVTFVTDPELIRPKLSGAMRNRQMKTRTRKAREGKEKG
jgi:hypothetical protein